MHRLKFLALLALLLFIVSPSFADDHTKMIGTWKLVSWVSEFQTTGEQEPVMGKNPVGYVIFTREGRMMAVITAEVRTPAKTDQDRANLFKSSIAFTGKYRSEGDREIIKVDASTRPEWVGGEQVRFIKFLDGDRFQSITQWMPSGIRPEKGTARAIMTFERVK